MAASRTNVLEYAGPLPDQLPRELARKEAIVATRPAPHVPQRQPGLISQMAQRLSRRGVAAAKAEVMNEVLAAMADLLYESEPGIGPVNFESRSGRIIVPKPWGHSGYKAWQLRVSEARALRHIMLQRTALYDPEPWVDFDAGIRDWVVNLRGYHQKRAAQQYLLAHPITAAEWLAAANAVRSAWSRKNGIG
jgi:hypothetical protein